MAKFDKFIEYNVAPEGCSYIGVYNGINRVGNIKIPNRMKTISGTPLYSFGCLSDVHLQQEDVMVSKTADSREDFRRALEELSSMGVAFTCVCGDLTQNGTEAELMEYKNYADAYSSVPVYAITGNHEAISLGSGIASVIQNYTGHPLYYSFTQGNDVFIMVGIKANSNASLFASGELQWLKDTLEANRNKRCFVFEHVRPQDACGNVYGIYDYDIWGGTEQTVFESLINHYRNAILFHGHSHLTLRLQTKDNEANIDTRFGMYSIHIPSLATPRTGGSIGAISRTELYAESEGYVVDVYSDSIVLKGRDFKTGYYIPIALYRLPTALKTITANSYTDSTGTVH